MKVIALQVKDENDVLRDLTTITKYDAAGNVEEVTDPLTRTTKFYYDARNRKVKEVRPAVRDGRGGPIKEPTLKFKYDKVGNLIASVDPRGGITVQSYDRWNRPVVLQQPYPGNRETRFYDRSGNLTKVTDGNGNSVRNKYDALNRMVETTDAQGITVRYGYDAVGNRTWVKDGLNQTTWFEYDGLNRNTIVRDSANKDVVFGYDALNRISRTDATGRETKYAYDNRNRLWTVSYTNRSQDDLTYSYDANGNILSVLVGLPAGSQSLRNVSYTYDALNRVETETSAGITHEYRYDAAGNRVKVSSPGGRTLISTFDALNRLETVTDSGLTTVYAYDLNGNVVEKELPNRDLVKTTYDAANRQATITGFGGRSASNPAGTQIYKYSLSYDRVGNLLASQELYSSAINSRVLNLKYDRANRLVEEKVQKGGVETVTGYGYSAANNRTWKAVSVNGVASSSSSYVYNKLNQLVSVSGASNATFTYDFNGNRSTRTSAGVSDIYSYDYENRLVNLTKPDKLFSYQYDYRTRRVERVEGATTTHVVFSGGTSVREGLRSGASWMTDVHHVRGSDWGGGVGGILYSVRPTGTSYAHYNSRGDVATRTDPNGAVQYQAIYEAFGTRSQEEGTTIERQKASTKEEDPTGLLNEGFRYRDLETGTFLTRDPAGFVDGPNLYAYVGQNPWSKFDPDGLWAEDLFLAVPSIAMGAKSLYNNIKEGNVGSAIVDAVGIAADVGAAALPGVPGGAGMAIKATRTAVSVAQKIDKTATVVQGVQATADAVKSGDVVSAVTGGASTVLGAKAQSPSGQTARDIRKKITNPDGSKGKADHQSANEKLIREMEAKHPDADEIRSNKSIEAETGLKRRPDVAVIKDGKVVAVGEVARTNKNGTIVSREQKKQVEYDAAGIPSTVTKLPPSNSR